MTGRYVSCPTCYGQRFMAVMVPGPDGDVPTYRDCPTCHGVGMGYVDLGPCPRCQNSYPAKGGCFLCAGTGKQL
jgi:DnaJ-class molecular chaperone